ncbi:MAG: peptidogalycan biosysnthesis protein, partial [Gammaproteobacteria bacterium]
MRVADDLSNVPCAQWNALAAAAQGRTTAQPFLRHEFLSSLAVTGCTGEAAGWIPRHLLLEDRAGALHAAVPLYMKTHSYGEYVFDWAWADAYEQHGLAYYPKG